LKLKFYLGTAVKEDLEIVRELMKLRDDFGVCISAYYYKVKSSTRKIVQHCQTELNLPVILDNGQIQAWRQKTLIKEEKLTEIISEVKPLFSFAPDVIGSPKQSLESLVRFIDGHEDLDLLAPLQAHNYGLLFPEKLQEEISILKESGYERFGFGKPYQLKFTRRETAKEFIPKVKPQVKYLHFMGYPFGKGLTGINLCESVDGGTYWTMNAFRVGIYKNPKEGAKLFSALMDVDLAVSDLHDKKFSSVDTKIREANQV